MKTFCNWCAPFTEHGVNLSCYVADHQKDHPAENFQPGPSKRVALVRHRQLLAVAAAYGVSAGNSPTGTELIGILIDNGVSLTPELRDTSHQPPGLGSMPTEILRKIMSYVVLITYCTAPQYPYPDYTAVLPGIFGNSSRTAYQIEWPGSINPARASLALHEAALSTLLQHDIIRFEIGDCSDWWGPDPAREMLLTGNITMPRAGYLKKIQHASLEYTDFGFFDEGHRGHYLTSTLIPLANVLTICPNLKTLKLRLSWPLARLHDARFNDEPTSDEDHEITKEDILSVASELHALPIASATLDLDYPCLTREMSFKVDCSAEDYEAAFMATYDKYFAPLNPEESFNTWRERAASYLPPK